MSAAPIRPLAPRDQTVGERRGSRDGVDASEGVKAETCGATRGRPLCTRTGRRMPNQAAQMKPAAARTMPTCTIIVTSIVCLASYWFATGAGRECSGRGTWQTIHTVRAAR